MTDLLPLFPLGTVVFPGMPLPLQVFEEKYRRMLKDRGDLDPAFGVVLLRSGQDVGSSRDLFDVGTAVRLVSQRSRRGGHADIVIEGTRRFEIKAINWDLGYGLATIEWRDDLVGDLDKLQRNMSRVIGQFDRYVRGVTYVTGRTFEGVRISDDPVTASYDLASRLPLHTWERQRLLELGTADERFESLLHLVRREVALLIKSGAAGLAINHPGQTFTPN